MSDMLIAFEFSLMAAGYKKKESAPISPLAQELLEYVNSKEYQQLIVDEMNNKQKHNNV